MCAWVLNREEELASWLCEWPLLQCLLLLRTTLCSTHCSSLSWGKHSVCRPISKLYLYGPNSSTERDTDIHGRLEESNFSGFSSQQQQRPNYHHERYYGGDTHLRESSYFNKTKSHTPHYVESQPSTSWGGEPLSWLLPHPLSLTQLQEMGLLGSWMVAAQSNLRECRSRHLYSGR